MAQAAMTMEARQRAMADAATSLSAARLKVALAGWGGTTRLGKLLEAIMAELYSVADEATLRVIAARFYEDEFNRREFVERQLAKREDRKAKREDREDKGKAPEGQAALPSFISDIAGSGQIVGLEYHKG